MDSTDFSELLNKKEDLHPDLQKCLHDVPKLGLCLRHPILYHLMYVPQMNAFLNKQYAVKKEYIDKAIAKKDFSACITMVERPYRWEYFERFSPDLNDEEYWDLFRYVWTDTENFWQCKEIATSLLEDPKRTSTRSQYLMNDDERAIFSDLPERLLIYRGCYSKNRHGLSWTTEPRVAKFFALRMRNKGQIITGTIEKSEIIAYLGGRDESEIVAFPQDVKEKKTEYLG